MSKVVIKNKKGKVIVVNKLTYPEAVNERMYATITTGMYDGFLPVSVRQKRKETQVECVVQGLITLNDYFSGIVTKKMFLDFVQEIISLIKLCDKNMININNMDLQGDRVFIEPQFKHVRCIFWPIVNNQQANPVHVFLKQLSQGIRFNPYEDCKYIESYNAFFDGREPFSVYSLERLVLRLQGKNTASGLLTPSVSLNNSYNEDLKEVKKHTQPRKVNIEYDPFAVVRANPMETSNVIKKFADSNYCSFCGSKLSVKANFCRVCGERLQEDTYNVSNNEIDFGTTILGANINGTTVLGCNGKFEKTMPVLVRKSTSERFTINKACYRIGIDPASCDLFISDNSYISRNHADIITRDNRYYVIDKHSTNKTYVDDKMVLAGSETEIYSGVKLRFGNEEFIFTMDS